MKIRKEQMDVFSQRQEEAFVSRMVMHLRDDFREERLARHIPESDLEELVRKGMEDARGYGVVYTDDVRLYLECMVTLGPEFDRDQEIPWVREVLRREDRDGHVKMNEINAYLVFGAPQGEA